MSDLISRQAAIEAMEQTYCDIERVKKRPITRGEQAIFLDMRGVVRSLPSVEPERTGKWEYVQYDGNPKIGNWHCSECRLIVNFGFEGAPYYHYCPGCGAEMEVSDNAEKEDKT